MSAGQATSQHRPPPWRDVRVLRVVGQFVFAVFVVALLWYLYNTLIGNLRDSGLPTGFDFLNQPGGFTVQHTDVSSSTPIWRVILTGVKNTLLVSAVGIILATVLGVLAGIARLASNWLVRKGAAFYVEAVRNVPVLVWIVFFWAAVFLRLPPIEEGIEQPGQYIINNQGIFLPSPTTPAGGGEKIWLLFVVAVLAALAVAWWRTRLNERTGTPHHRVLWGLATAATVIVAGFVLLGVPVEMVGPERDRFRIRGGFALTVGYLGLLVGLVVYTASHIAEIVRGAILAVPKGQQEAAQALALSGFQRMRHVILPQALRIMVPPTANQYLNLTKNSSLAVAIGYADVTQIVKQVISNGRPAPQNIAILMGIYLVFSLTISAFTNLYNRRIQYAGR